MPKKHASVGRPAGVRGSATLAAIRAAGTQLLYQEGYEGMSLRHLAAAAGIQVGSLYNHIQGKQALLALLLNDYTSEMLQGLEPALASSSTPADRLRAFVRYHIGFHTRRLPEASICLSELRHLKGEQRRSVQELRDRYERQFGEIVDAGIAAGDFSVTDPGLAAFAVLGMITSVIGWYKAEGQLTPEQIAEVYSDLALATLGAA